MSFKARNENETEFQNPVVLTVNHQGGLAYEFDDLVKMLAARLTPEECLNVSLVESALADMTDITGPAVKVLLGRDASRYIAEHKAAEAQQLQRVQVHLQPGGFTSIQLPIPVAAHARGTFMSRRERRAQARAEKRKAQSSESIRHVRGNENPPVVTWEEE